ncbi:MAG: cytochrome c oxidase assembly protein [Vulcanimicrobiaceae bacterium]
MIASLAGWHLAPSVGLGAVLATIGYLYAVAAFRRRRGRAWPKGRTALFILGIASGVAAIASPLDAAGDTHFAAHMVQHLVLTDITAPFLLLSGPILLALGATPPPVARRIVNVLRGRVAHVLAFPLVTWATFVLALWTIHFSPFFEAALESAPLHLVEHALYVGTALLFWLPVIAIGPTPWMEGVLAFPLRMLYLLVAMPAEGFLGFSIYGATHVFYRHYARAGLADQQMAGEIMWIGSGFVMFVAFMIVGYEWSRNDERLGERSNARQSST